MQEIINGYSQAKMLELNVDLASSLILKEIVDMYNSNSDLFEYKEIENKKYMLCTYNDIYKVFPIIGSVKTIIRKIGSLVEKDILKKKLLKEKNGIKGNFLYFTLGENYTFLVDSKR